jgi:hypothetical protein
MASKRMAGSFAKKLGLYQVILVVLGALVAYGAVRLRLSPLVGAGVAVAGLGVLVGGLGNVLARSVGYSDSGLERGNQLIGYESHRGLTAVLAGAFWMMLGGLAVVGGAAHALGLGSSIERFLTGHPGIALLAIGLPVATYGIVSVLGTTEAAPRRSFGRFLMSLPERLVGVVLLVGGLAAVAAGGLDLLAPGTFEGLRESLRDLAPPRPW